MRKVLAIDMGATSIRGVLAGMEQNKIQMEEVFRLPHTAIESDGKVKWQWQEMMTGIIDTIHQYAGEIQAIGIDSWGVDYGILDAAGNLLESPLSYRDPVHRTGYLEAIESISEEEIFRQTGNQIMEINTLFQLLAYRKQNPKKWQQASKILMIPDLIPYMLTGVAVGEKTIWSTSQLLNLETGEYSEALMKCLGLEKSLFPTPVEAGTIVGNTRNSRYSELQKYDIAVVSVCGHDTASASLISKAFYEKDTLFISCGTWSLAGCVAERSQNRKEIFEAGLTNELTYQSKTLLMKNMTGLYLLEKYKKYLENRWARKISYDEINSYLEQSSEFAGWIDMEANFEDLDKTGPEAINAYFRQTNQPIPTNEMAYFRVLYDSLAESYGKAAKALEKGIGHAFTKVHLIGGGARSKYLCQKVADCLQLPVFAGPYEAAAMGNVLVQLKAIGEIESIEEGLSRLKEQEEIVHYLPSNCR